MKIRQYIEKFGLWIVSITSGIPMKSGGWNHNDEAFLYRGLIAELQISKNKYLAYKIHKDNYWRAFDRTALQEKMVAEITEKMLNKIRNEK